MKKTAILLTLAMLLTGVTATAQYRRPTTITVTQHRPPLHNGYGRNPFERNDMYFGVRLGLNASNVRSDAPALNGTGLVTGVNVGAAIGFGLTHQAPLYLETGVYYSQKGGKSDNGSGKFTYDLNYFEVPLLLKYKYFTSSDIAIEPFAGGYVSCGVGGQIKDYDNRNAFSSYDEGYFKRMDGGLKIGCGVEFRMLYLDLSYDIGLANVGQDDFDDTRNGCFTVNVGVNF